VRAGRWQWLLVVMFTLAGAMNLNAAEAGEDTREGEVGQVKGTVTYRERIQLPPGVLITVRLEDVSRVDAPSALLGQSRFPAREGPPYAFAVEYYQAAILPGNRYALRATLTLRGQLLFTSTRHYPAFESPGGVDILVHKARSNPLAPVD
jgi:putative lipoprotein